MDILTTEQERQYEEEGFLLVAGLIPPDVAARGQAALWNALGADPNDSATWANIPFSGSYTHPDLTACCTPQVRAVAARLAGEDPASFGTPSSAYTINVFPQEGSWSPHGPHIDHAIKAHGHKTFPRPFRIASITYLNDVPLQGAPTVVWPGSHKKIERLAQSDPDRFEMMWILNQALSTLGLGEPVAVSARMGDVLFYHYLCAHAGSRNATTTPRLALNRKW